MTEGSEWICFWDRLGMQCSQPGPRQQVVSRQQGCDGKMLKRCDVAMKGHGNVMRGMLPQEP